MIQAIRERVLSRAKTAYLELFDARRRRIYFDPPVASFTFDDVPMSAFENGVPILEEFGVRGTFYVSLGIEGPPKDFIREDEVKQLYKRGHTIGCHTWSHYSLHRGSVAGLVTDARRNSKELALILGCRIDHFAYPFGEVSLRAKREMAQLYLTLRGIRRGINSGIVDLNLIRAIPMYTEVFSEKYILSVIKRTAKLRGWILFYTHGVTERPEQYDSTPRQLRSVVKFAQEEGFRILPMAEATSSFLPSEAKQI